MDSSETKPKMDPYAYVANANLVLKQNRRDVPRRDKDGIIEEVETLHGKIDVAQMGQRVFREKPVVLQSTERASGVLSKPKHAPKGQKYDIHTLLKGNQFSGLTYIPKSSSSFAIYEMLLNFVSNHFLMDMPEEALRSAVDDIIIILKDAEKRDIDKKAAIELAIDVKEISQDEFAQLSGLSNKIMDFSAEDSDSTEAHEDKKDTLQKFRELDEGITIALDDEYEEDAQGENAFHVQDEEEPDSDTEMKEENQPTIVDMKEHFQTNYLVASTLPLRDKYWVDVRDIDAFWIQRQLSQYYEASHQSLDYSKKVFDILFQSIEQEKNDSSIILDDIFRFLENHLGLLLDFDKFDMIKTFILNRKKIIYGIQLAQSKADPSAYHTLLEEISGDHEGREIIKWLETPIGHEPEQLEAFSVLKPVEQEINQENEPRLPVLDISTLGFTEGNHTMTNKKVDLPSNSWKKTHLEYEEIFIPAPQSPPFKSNERLVLVSELPAWAQVAFSGISSLNRIQSAIYQTAFNTFENMLICAPTGAGKTNVALLSILQILSQFGADHGPLDTGAFKIIYVAPMKALVQEIVTTFKKRLGSFNLAISELSGDVQLTKCQIGATQIIVTTPEKWDIVTRKHNPTNSLNLKLVIFDEVHLLHDERGPVIESLVARMQRNYGGDEGTLRFIGLSATLPNYQDVGAFLNVKKECLFHFDSSFRPCPLSQLYYGLTAKKPMKRMSLMNNIVYEKSILTLEKKDQMIVFVHSRRDTFKTALFVRDTAIKNESLHKLLPDINARPLLEATAEKVKNKELAELLPYGLGIHHAGLARSDRAVVEELFSSGHLGLLVSTSTLAWGVNLPAHTVLIKGTQVYSPERGEWTQLSSQDILQMFGRSGRPQFDSHGEGILLTTASDLQYYLSICQQQLPIESQMLYPGKLAEALNAEIVLGNVSNLQEAHEWIKGTYLYVRMRKSPHLYLKSMPEDFLSSVMSLIHSVALLLERSGLIRYDTRSGYLEANDLGRITSHYYLSHSTVSIFAHSLHANSSVLDILRVFSMSHEFSRLTVRSEEKAELSKLIGLVPIPVKEECDDPLAKVNVLLQTWLSGLTGSLKGFALLTDLVYVTQSAGRLVRALLEVALSRGWTSLVKKCHDLMRVISKKTWPASHPLRQFRDCLWQNTSSTGLSLTNQCVPVKTLLDPLLLARLEKKDIPIESLLQLSVVELGELYKLESPAKARSLHRLVHSVPRLDIGDVTLQPIDQETLQISISLKLQDDFQWDSFLHNASGASSSSGEPLPALFYTILLEDQDESQLFFHDSVVFYPNSGLIQRTFTVPLKKPLVPVMMMRVLSDAFLHADTSVPIALRGLVLPKDIVVETETLDLTPIELTLEQKDSQQNFLGGTDCLDLYCRVMKAMSQARLIPQILQGVSPQLSALQTQCWRPLFLQHQSSIFVTAPSNSGVSVLLVLNIMKHFFAAPRTPIWIVSPDFGHLKSLSSVFSILTGNQVPLLEGVDSSAEILSLTSPLVLLTSVAFERVSRRRSFYSSSLHPCLFLFDLELLDAPLEAALSRTHLHPNYFIRIIAQGLPIRSFSSLATWLHIPPGQRYQFLLSNSASIANTKNVPAIIHQVPFRDTLEAERYCFHSILDKVSSIIQDGNTTCGIHFSCWESREEFMELLHDHLMLKENFSGAEEKYDPVSVIEYLERFGVSRDTLDGKIGLFLQKDLAENNYYFADEIICTSSLLEDGDGNTMTFSRSLRGLLLCQSRASKNCEIFSSQRHFRQLINTGVLSEGLSARGNTLKSRMLLPLESDLFTPSIYSRFYLLPDMALSTEGSWSDWVNALSRTFYYQRLVMNPNYYGCSLINGCEIDAEVLSEHVSLLVEQGVAHLERTQMVSRGSGEDAEKMEIDETRDKHNDSTKESEIDLIQLTDKGLITSYYGIHEESVLMFALSLRPTTKSKGILELVASSIEFDRIPVEPREIDILFSLYMKRLPYKLSAVQITEKHEIAESHVKTFILIQLYMLRKFQDLGPLGIFWAKQFNELILPVAFPLLGALMDIAAAQSFLTPALVAIDLMQCLTWASHPAVAKDTLPSFWRQLPSQLVNTWSTSTIGASMESIYDVIESVVDKKCLSVGEKESMLIDSNDAQYTSSCNLVSLWNEFIEAFPASLTMSLSYSINEGSMVALHSEAAEDEQETLEEAIHCKHNDILKLQCQLTRPFLPSIFTNDYKYLGAPIPSYSPLPFTDKRDNWWVIVAHQPTKTLLAIKKLPIPSKWTNSTEIEAASNEIVSLTTTLVLSLEFDQDSPLITASKLNDVSSHPLVLYLVTDGWLGADQEFPIQLVIE